MLMLAGAILYSASMLADCGPAVSPETTRAIIEVESGGDPYAIGDNTERRSYAPGGQAEAVRLARRLLAQGHNLDLGLMQVNSIHLSDRLTLEDLFDPCRNIRAGTTILADFYRRHQGPDQAQSLFKALSAYNTGRAWRGASYINRILAAAGAGYRVVPPPSEEQAKPDTKTARSRNGRAAAAESPLFFDNLSTSMTAGEY